VRSGCHPGVIILDITLLKEPDIVLWLAGIRSQFRETKSDHCHSFCRSK
jgi:hypothetical protein